MKNEKSILEQLEPKKMEFPADDFFNSLAASTINGMKKQQQRSKLKIVYYSISAVAAVLIVLLFLFNQSNSDTILPKNEIGLAKLKTDEISEYLEEEKQQQTALKSDESYVPVVAAGMKNIEDLFVSISTGDLVQYMEEEDVDIEGEDVDELFY